MISTETLERKQVPVYLLFTFLGGVAGLLFPMLGQALEWLIYPVLAILLYSMFLQVPLTDIKSAFKEKRFLFFLLVGNFIFIPLLIWMLLTLLDLNVYITLGVAMVLLTPCIDYVIVFCKFAKGESRLLLAATPLLLLLQIILLPFYLYLILGSEFIGIVAPKPFLTAFFVLIMIPLGLAMITQTGFSTGSIGKTWCKFMHWLLVPAMGLTLFVVIASQIFRISTLFTSILLVIPIYMAYALLIPLLVKGLSPWLKLSPRFVRALVFGLSTRNSLVVLPLALAVPEYGIFIAAVIITQTLVELVAQVLYIRWVPILMPEVKT